MSTQDKNQCLICLGTIRKNSPGINLSQVFSCNCDISTFHNTCLTRWIKKDSSCPICRIQMKIKRKIRKYRRNRPNSLRRYYIAGINREHLYWINIGAVSGFIYIVNPTIFLQFLGIFLIFNFLS